MIDVSEKDIGRKVLYFASDRSLPPEEGVITSFSPILVFVRYGSDLGSKATRPQDLEWLNE